ncbi:MAG: bifunctional methylenetetrahydrofolate dehydrogenase/methenyltetrahydrofolate cyclohydrolase FolD [Bauldia sp.]|nr:bifunctional methylenetetrahydrofolate dehydrogenase/methenyltetrahydrofolate cyclohydrolase FolD [Bauldia sp.]
MAPAPSSSSERRATVIDGKAVAAEVTEKIDAAARAFAAATGKRPGLAVILVGEDPGSQVYVRNKGRAAERLGFHSVQHTLPVTVTEAALLELVENVNADDSIHGLLVQLPLPAHIDPKRVAEAIAPSKDVDGLTPINIGRLASGDGAHALIPCTPAGSVILIRRALGNDLTGRNALVIGRSNIVGRPVAQLLIQENCTVTIAHSKTRDLPALARQAEILIAAVGRPEMVRGDWVREGACVIDVGVNRLPGKDGDKARLVGDVAFEEAATRAGWITPVPGGVGAMTIAMLMANTLTAAARQTGFALILDL